ncbi:MAG: hypothetical protein DMF63_18060 [Acidobacteria bacterium]|nr:MAG: hypothetical protein DMF63_18060 [Acidobacteriota bacterium]
MERVFQIIAAVLICVAAYFFWAGSKESAFVAAVLCCVSFFLSIRFQMKERNRSRAEDRANGSE